MTLDRFIGSYEGFIGMLNKGTVYISKKYGDKVFEALDNDDEESIIRLVEQEKVKKYKAENFDKLFKENLENDLSILLEIKKLWDGVTTDPKIDKFEAILKADKVLKDNKLIIFTESKETAGFVII